MPPLVAMKLTLLEDYFLYLPEVWVNGLGNLTATSSNNRPIIYNNKYELATVATFQTFSLCLIMAFPYPGEKA